MQGINCSKLMFAMCELFQVRTRIKLRLDDKILSIDVGELDDLFTADVMSDVIEESTKEALEIEPESGGLGTSEKTSGQKSNEHDQSSMAKGIDLTNVVPTLITNHLYIRVVDLYQCIKTGVFLYTEKLKQLLNKTIFKNLLLEA